MPLLFLLATLLRLDHLKMTSLRSEILKLDEEDFIFIRETNEDIFKIEKNKGSITLKELNTTFDIELSKCTYTKEDNNYTIVYSIEGDNNEVKIKLKDLI